MITKFANLDNKINKSLSSKTILAHPLTRLVYCTLHTSIVTRSSENFDVVLINYYMGTGYYLLLVNTEATLPVKNTL